MVAALPDSPSYSTEPGEPRATSIRVENRRQVVCLESPLEPGFNRSGIGSENSLTKSRGYCAEAFLEEPSQYFRFAFRLTLDLAFSETLVVIRLSKPSHDALLPVGHEPQQGLMHSQLFVHKGPRYGLGRLRAEKIHHARRQVLAEKRAGELRVAQYRLEERVVDVAKLL